MSKRVYPTFDIRDLTAHRSVKDILTIDRFKEYLANNPHLHTTHRHSFYHLVFFTKGSGEQLIDFTRFPVKPGYIYFMNPSQVHRWNFTGPVEGFIINFAATFFDELHISSGLLAKFPFFTGDLDRQMFVLKKATQNSVTALFEDMIQEQERSNPGANLVIAAKMLELFVEAFRDMPVKENGNPGNNFNPALFQAFTNLVEQKFRDMRLPNEYASSLHITPARLNTICKNIAGIPAGEIIRNRVVLEAKRLLVNLDLGIAEIASDLRFQDTSYFVRFFKRYTSQTPEAFRQEHYKN